MRSEYRLSCCQYGDQAWIGQFIAALNSILACLFPHFPAGNGIAVFTTHSSRKPVCHGPTARPARPAGRPAACDNKHQSHGGSMAASADACWQHAQSNSLVVLAARSLVV